MTISAVTIGCAILMLVALVGTASALESNGTDSVTQGLIQQGIALRRAGQDEAALKVFLEAEVRNPNSVRILLHVTTAAEGAGKWLLAYAYFQRAATYRNDPYYQRNKASIRQIEEVLSQHIGQFRALGTPAGAEVLLNGQVVAQLPMDQPIPLETGSYVLEVRSAGYFSMTRPVVISGGFVLMQESADLMPIGQRAAEATVENKPSPKAIKLTPDKPERTGPVWQARWITWALAGTGAAMIATSGIAFALREDKASQWNDDNGCLNKSSPYVSREQLCGSIRESAESAQRVGIITAALGVGFGGAALAHWLWSSNQRPGKSSRVGFLPTCEPGIGNLTCKVTY